ncbi:MAG: flagellar filament capping protein FliD [SAR324 cluster bacterium]|nr:flagellar filament capping protein FliD [SAR324 cluster bacterium]
MAEMNPNAVTGLGSKLDTREIIGRFIEVEKRKVIPVEQRKTQKTEELDSWNAVKVEVTKLHSVSKNLSKADIWEGKNVESSDPKVIGVKATRRAQPGKTNIAVDALAAAHQITSQGYETSDENVGIGKITLQVGDPEEQAPVTVTINKAHNTLEGVKQAINDSDAEVEAFVIKTGSAEKPYQLLLTSMLTGEQGRIDIKVEMKDGDVEPPSYKNSFDETSEWEGVGAEEPVSLSRSRGASTPISGIVGQYTGTEDVTYTFTATQGGVINSEQGVTVSWTDTKGRSGNFEINKFNYSPGQPLEFADGLSVQFSDGEVISGDSFTVTAYSERSPLLWWLSEEERAPAIEGPTDWSKKATEGGLKIKGTYSGEEDQTLIFRIEGSGQVGGPKPIFLHYEFIETGETGKINIGYPYLSDLGDPNALTGATAYDFVDEEGLFTLDFMRAGGDPSKLTLPNGLQIEIPPGILNDGDTAEIDLNAKVSDKLWWLPAERRGLDGKVDETLTWQPFLDDDGNPVGRANVKDGIQPFGAQYSTAEIAVSGEYTEDLEKNYTFTAQKKGGVGITRVLKVKWEDNEGNSGMIDFGEGYKPGTMIPFNSGLSVALGEGNLVESDTFMIDTRTPTVQRPQDAIMRLGATDLGGGIEISRPTNFVDDIIPGVNLELLSTSEKPVTITVSGDTERAKETIREFVEAYNTLNATITEVTKFDQALNEAAPLLSDRTVHNLQNEIANTTISAVRGLPKATNMLFSLGLRIDDKGVMSLDESKLDEKIGDNFAEVANVFRSNGDSENNAIDFLGVTKETKINPSGYEVDVTQVAKRGTYTGTPLPQSIRIGSENNELFVTADGRSSEAIKLREDVYAPSALARSIQSRLADDKILGKRRIQVVADEGRLKFISGTYGANSAIEIAPGKDKEIDSLGLTNGTATKGQDVKGTIDGLEAEGRGQLLVGKESTDASGLRLYVDLSEDQLQTGSETKVLVTKGVGTQLDERLKDLLDPVKGEIPRSTKDISEEIKAYDDQIRRLNKRIEAKREELQIKFAKLDSKMGRLKSQQNYLGQQLAALSGNKKKDS